MLIGILTGHCFKAIELRHLANNFYRITETRSVHILLYERKNEALLATLKIIQSALILWKLRITEWIERLRLT